MPTRREFLAAAGASQLRGASRPNLLCIIIDQLSGLAVPPYNSLVPMPTCRRIAAKGVQFTHAFTAGMTCGPSRASLDTGLATPAHRVGQVRPAPAIAQSLPATLAASGYVTTHPHGYHLEAERAQHEKWLAELGYPQPISSIYGSEALAKYADLPLKWKCGRIGLAPEHAFDAYCAQRAVQFLETNREKPFACFLQLRGPHDPYMAPRGFDTLVDPAKLKLPPRLASELATKPPRQKASFESQGASRMTESQLRHVLALYHGMSAFSDHCAGLVLDRLEQLGLADNTVVALLSDHGDTMAHHGFMSKDFAMYEPAMRVPLLISAPGQARAKVCADPVSGIDLFPTLCELMGLPAPTGIHGESLVSRWQGKKSDPDRPIFAAQGVPGKNRAIMLRTRDYKYARYDDGGEELYHLKADPGELNNLAAPTPSMLNQMSKQVDEWLRTVERPSS